jgi:hypothetical protein
MASGRWACLPLRPPGCGIPFLFPSRKKKIGVCKSVQTPPPSPPSDNYIFPLPMLRQYVYSHHTTFLSLNFFPFCIFYPFHVNFPRFSSLFSSFFNIFPLYPTPLFICFSLVIPLPLVFIPMEKYVKKKRKK